MAGDAQAMQAEFLRRRGELQDMLMQQYQDADKAGAFDPQKQIDQLEADTARYEGRDAGNLAGALEVAGYKKGDSEIGTRLDDVKLKYRQNLDTMRAGIRRQSFFDKLNALRATELGGAPELQVAGDVQNRAAAMQPNWGGFFNTLMPFAGGKSGGAGSTASAALPGGNASLGQSGDISRADGLTNIGSYGAPGFNLDYKKPGFFGALRA